MKKLKLFFIILLTIIVVSFALFGGYCIYLKIDTQKRIERTENIERIQWIDTVITNVEINEADGMEPDEELLSKLKDEITKIQDNFEYKQSLMQTMRMIHICTYFEMTYADELKGKLMEFYNEELDAFEDTPGAVSVDSNRSEKTQAIIETMFCADYIYQYVPKEEFDIVSRCATWYEENINQVSKKNEDAIDIAQECFWFLFEHDAINKVSYMKMLPNEQKYINEEKEDIESGKINMNTMYSASLYADCQEIFGLGSDAKGLDQKIYEKLDSVEAFEYYSDDPVSLIVLNSNLKELEHVSKNTYYVEHINDWLLEYYNNYIVED